MTYLSCGGLRSGRRSALVIAVLYTLTALPLHAAERCISSWRRTTWSRSARTSRSRCSTVGFGSGWRREGWRRSWRSRRARSTTRRSRSYSSPSRRALRFFASRDRRVFLPAGFVVGVILAVSLVQLAPTIVYRVTNGTERGGREALLVRERELQPQADAAAPAGRRAPHRRAGVPEGGVHRSRFRRTRGRAATLGIVASVGFLWLLAVVLLAVVGAWPGVIARFRGIAALTLASVLVATTGGLSTLLAVVWPQIRAWNRLSIFIAFFALLAVGLLLESLRPASSRSRRSVRSSPASSSLGALDQTTPFFIPPHAGLAADYRADRSWYRSVEGRLPEGAIDRAAATRAVP